MVCRLSLQSVVGRLALWAVAGVLLVYPVVSRAADNWTIDPKRTHIRFSIAAVGYDETQGEFRDFSGRISIDFNRPERSSAAFTVKASSIETGSRGLDDYIKTAFFDAKAYPEMRFVSTHVEKIDAHHARVTGDLTLTGTTKPVTFDVTVDEKAAGGRREVGFVAQGLIQRSQFGMIFGLPLVSNEVKIVVATEATGS